MIPEIVVDAATEHLSRHRNGAIDVLSTHALSGGSIHQAARLETRDASFFIKWNKLDAAENFAAEARGLSLLRESATFRIPAIIAHGESGGYAFLLLEYIEPADPGPEAWQRFGECLARLHSCTERQFGLDHDNFIGALPQSNKRHDTWHEFFVVERLEKQLRLAADSTYADRTTIKSFSRLFGRIGDLIPEEAPALLHGDLWKGNVIFSAAGEGLLIDPAVYYGHREAEIAFTRLFGGFGREMYEQYHKTLPLEQGWKERSDLFNLYPLLVHLNLFGLSYLGEIQGILKRFV